MDLGLKGKVAVVAAASQGLGRAIAEELAQEGAHVALCSRDRGRIEAAAKEIAKRTGAETLGVAADVTRGEDVERFVAAAAEKWGAVHIAVANAGGPPAKLFAEATPEDWQRAVELNLMSAVHLARAALPRMQKQKWGRLLFLTSASVKQPIEGLLLSNSVRSAVAGLAKTLSNEYGRDNILVNVLCPGYLRTERLEELATAVSAKRGIGRDEIYREWAAANPVGRIGEPRELAALAAFLASERASYITGTAMAVDGGRTKSLL